MEEGQTKTPDASFHIGKFHYIAHLGLRVTIGAIFIAHSYGKFSPSFAELLPQMGIPIEMQIPIALGELIAGILIIIGVLSRISAAFISAEMIGTTFYIKKALYFIGHSGVELDLILLAGALVVMVSGPGKISVSHKLKIPRFLH
jgi:putative oxidoreductase